MSELDDQLARLERVAAAQLHDVVGRDPIEALRTLPEVVEAAAGIWAALPESPQVTADSDPMDRLLQATRTIGQVLRTHGGAYDSATARDEGLLPLGEALTETEALDLTSSDPAVARGQLMHIVHLSAHAARVRVAGDLIGPATRGQDRPLLQRGLAEATSVDELSGSYLRQAHSRRTTHAAQEPQDPRDLGLMLARWDITAHRAIVTADHPATLIHLAAGQSLSYQALQPLLRAIQPSGVDAQSEQLISRLEQAGRAWTDLGAFWQDLQGAPRSSPVGDRALLEAFRDLRTGFRDVLMRPNGEPRSAEETVSRLDVRDTLESIHQMLVSTAGHARAVDDVTQRPERIPVNARAGQRALTTYLSQETYPDQFLNQDGSAVITPRDIMLDRPVPLPQALRAAAEQHSTEVVRASTAAFHASGLAPTVSAPPSPVRGMSRRPEHVDPSPAGISRTSPAR
ncbi:hypothetical protein BJF86_13355 [Serinicoccus sp. CNJ-927]|uniref:hypothetical protein n=1 Tax=Serinicoccus sp. CNJ-927 TaxID=1904970 RepID=UPI00096294D1|nr:hypothetical protein [Serinicoccus sp. CNJ-927]OLT43941.1 hypothetical protein BJF86_13355 [Serinicoccus sp. CNJ-927]